MTGYLTVDQLTGFDVHYGIRVSHLGQDCEAYIALGHVTPPRMAVVADRLNYSYTGDRFRDYGWDLNEAMSGVRQGWGLFTPCRDPEYDYDGWRVAVSDTPTPGALPITTLGWDWPGDPA